MITNLYCNLDIGLSTVSARVKDKSRNVSDKIMAAAKKLQPDAYECFADLTLSRLKALELVSSVFGGGETSLYC